MFTLIVTEKGGQPKRMEFDKDEITIGRVPGNDVILPKGNVSKRHSRVVRQDGRFFVVDLKSTNGTYLNGRRITTPSVIRPGDKIYVGDFVVMVDMGDNPSADAEVAEELEPETGSPNFPADGPPPEAQPARPDVSAVEPLPLDQEPPESAPPPAMPGPARAPGAPLMSPGGPIGGPRPPMMTQPLGSGPPGPGAPPPSASGALPQRPTQPPPGRGSSPGPRSPGAPTGPLNAPSQPGVNRPPPMGAPSPRAPAPLAGPPGPMGGPPMGGPPMGGPPMGGPPGAMGGPPGPMGGPPPMMPPGPPRGPGLGGPPSLGGPPMGGPPMGGPPSGPAMEARRSPSGAMTPPGAGAGRATVDADAMDDDDNQATGFPPPQAAAAMAPPPSAGGPPPGPSPSTMNIANSVVDAVIQSHRASAQGEPVPPGREYASALADVVNEARSNGAPSVGDRMADAATRARVRTVVESIARRREGLPQGVTPERLTRDATAEISGAGAIESALEEPEVTTVVVESSGRVLVGRGDALGPSPLWFSGDDAVTTAVDRLLHANGVARKNESVIDATLTDGTRLTAVFPPAAPAGPTVVVERPAGRVASLIDLVARSVLSQQAMGLLGHALTARRNIVVAGPVGSGRSTVLGALVAAVLQHDRCVLVESRAHLGRGLRDVTSIDPQGDWERAMDVALRLRPQRIVVADASEAAAGALVGMLVTGVEGALFVAEGPSPVSALQRLASAAAGNGAGTREDALARLAASRPLLVQMARLADGTCRVASIGEARPADGGIHVDEAFALRVDATPAGGRIEASLVATGIVPAFAAN